MESGGNFAYWFTNQHYSRPNNCSHSEPNVMTLPRNQIMVEFPQCSKPVGKH